MTAFCTNVDLIAVVVIVAVFVIAWVIDDE